MLDHKRFSSRAEVNVGEKLYTYALCKRLYIQVQLTRKVLQILNQSNQLKNAETFEYFVFVENEFTKGINCAIFIEVLFCKIATIFSDKNPKNSN
jgi:hypothetical protein